MFVAVIEPSCHRLCRCVRLDLRARSIEIAEGRRRAVGAALARNPTQSQRAFYRPLRRGLKSAAAEHCMLIFGFLISRRKSCNIKARDSSKVFATHQIKSNQQAPVSREFVHKRGVRGRKKKSAGLQHMRKTAGSWRPVPNDGISFSARRRADRYRTRQGTHLTARYY